MKTAWRVVLHVLVCLFATSAAGCTWFGGLNEPSTRLVDRVLIAPRCGDPIEAVSLTEDRLFVGDGNQVMVFDVAEPAAPKLLHSQAIAAHSLDWASGLLYVGTSDGIQIYQAKDDGSLALTGEMTGFSAAHIRADAGHLYTSSGNLLRVLDRTDPLQLVELAQFVFSGGDLVRVDRLILGDGVLIAPFSLISCTWPFVVPYGYQIVDVRTPASPYLRGYEADGSGAWYCGGAISGGIGYLVNDGSVATIETQPSSLSELGRVQLSGELHSTAEVSGDVLIVPEGDLNFRIFDAGDPNLTAERGNLPVDRLSHRDAENLSLFKTLISSNGTTVAATHMGGVVLVGVSNPADPRQMAIMDLVTTPAAFTVDGAVAYVADLSMGLQIFKLDERGGSSRIAVLPVRWAVDVAVDGNDCYVLQRSGSVTEIDVSDPSEPAERAHREDRAVGIHLDGDLLYIVREDGIAIYDATAGEWPSSNVIESDSPPLDVATVGDRLFVLTDVVTEYDVSDPAHPAMVDAWEGRYGAYTSYLTADALRVVGVSAWDSVGMVVIPQRVDFLLEGPENVAAISLDRGILAAAAGDEVALLDLRDGTNPVYVGTIAISGRCVDVQVDNGRVYTLNMDSDAIIEVWELER